MIGVTWRACGSGRWPVILATGALLTLGIGLACSGLLSAPWSRSIDDASQFTAALVATVACWFTAARHAGGQRWWRVWMGAGTCGWMIGQGLWSWYRLVDHVELPSPSPADIGYLTLPVFALISLISLAADESAPAAPWRYGGRAETLLDGLMVTGALFVFTWAAVLGPVVHTGAATPLAYSVAIAYPVTDFLLTVIVVLLLGVSAASVRPQLVILGIGLFGLSVSDSIFAYSVSSAAPSMPVPADAGFVVGLALVALAALTPAGRRPGWEVRPAVRRSRLLLPYVPVAAMVVFIVVDRVRGAPMDPVRMAVESAVVALLIIRQAVTLLQTVKLAGSRARLVLATDRSRQQLERDLHDGVQHRLISIALEVRRAEAAVPAELAELRAQLSEVVAGLNDTVDDVRELSRGIHPAILTQGGLQPALRALARRSGVPVRMDVRLPGRQPEPVEIAAYYLVAEALANVAKYAQADLVRVEVFVQRNCLHLTVLDDGVGGADPRRGTGLIGLADRIEALGGTFTLDSPPGQGTRLHAELPLDQS